MSQASVSTKNWMINVPIKKKPPQKKSNWKNQARPAQSSFRNFLVQPKSPRQNWLKP
jgi:hypothetical protein